MDRYDIAVIGTGPAGLSAAVTATIRNKKVLLLGSKNLSEKLVKAHEIQNYLGFPAVSGKALAEAFTAHLDKMGIAITEKRITAVYAMGDWFALQSGDEMLEASSVILATGVVQGKPLPGETELLGRGVSYCATCDAPLYRGKSVAVVGYSQREEAEAAFLSEVCGEVFYFPMYSGNISSLPKSVCIVREKVTAVETQDEKKLLRTNENVYYVDGVFILREAVAPGQLVPGLETNGPHVTANRRMETSIPGIFACGDISGLPYQYIKAAGEGNVAALSAVEYLDKQKRRNENGQKD